MIERQTTYTPLGLRFWDAVGNRPITDKLNVRAIFSNRPPVAAFRTHSGIYAFQNLPGLRALDYPVEGAIVTPRLVTIAVTDQIQRFMPVRFQVELPISAYAGVYRPNFVDTNNPGEPRFYLFSTPTRTPPIGMAVIRADLVTDTGAPAVAAFVQLTIAGRTHFAYSDARGGVAILFAWPMLATDEPPFSQAWNGTLQIRYQSADDPNTRWDFSRIRNQALAEISAATPPSFQPSLDFTLNYGRELALGELSIMPAAP